MANDRLRLRCTACGGASRWIAKHLGEGWYITPALEDALSSELTKFFDEHDTCSMRAPRTFEVEYEVGE